MIPEEFKISMHMIQYLLLHIYKYPYVFKYPYLVI